MESSGENIRSVIAENFKDDLGQQQIDQFIGLLTEEVARSGDLILKQGQDSDRLYIIGRGRIEVLIDSKKTNEPIMVAELVPGELFGDMSFIDARPVSATIKAVEESSVWYVSREDLENKGPDYLGLYSGLIKAIAVTNVDFDAIRNLAHDIKGSAANASAKRVSLVAAKLQDRAEHENSPEIDRLIDLLEAEFWLLKNHLS